MRASPARSTFCRSRTTRLPTRSRRQTPLYRSATSLQGCRAADVGAVWQIKPFAANMAIDPTLVLACSN